MSAARFRRRIMDTCLDKEGPPQGAAKLRRKRPSWAAASETTDAAMHSVMLRCTISKIQIAAGHGILISAGR
jgi:hypothetical protein